MLSKDNEKALKEALKDPNFPQKDVVKMTDRRRNTFRCVIQLGLKLGKLPQLPGLGKRLADADRAKNDLYMLSQTGAVKNLKPKGRSWEIPQSVWAKLLQAAHEHGGKFTDHPEVKVNTGDKSVVTGSSLKPVKSRSVRSVTRRLETLAFKEIKPLKTKSAPITEVIADLKAENDNFRARISDNEKVIQILEARL